MAYTAPNQYNDENKNVITDLTFGLSYPPEEWFESSPRNKKVYDRLFALCQYAWVTNNGWVYNFCKDVARQLSTMGNITPKQLECLTNNEARALTGEYKKRT